jgi:bifunctional non-homologous end joining protein LigD
MPPEGAAAQAGYLDSLVEQGHTALELPFVKEFPWKEKQCHAFGLLAAERGMQLSVHAPYFAVLTVVDDDRGKQAVSALEHTMKIGSWLQAPVIVAHLGHTHGEEPDVLMERVESRLESIRTKVEDLGVGLGLETAGNDRSFGTLGDIAHLAGRFSFVRPVVDWAHLHAMTGGGLTTTDSFQAVFTFIKDSFSSWMIQPLHTQFTDNEFGPGGEIRHIPYGEGSLRVAPMIEAARRLGISLTVISEARENESHQKIWDEMKEAEASSNEPTGRPVASSDVAFPDPVRAVKDGKHFQPVGLDRPLRLSNLDKVFFPDIGYTKGDLIQYYASISSLILPHLVDRPLSMNRFPDGIGGPSFYEKRAPGHQPEWMRKVPVVSDSQGGVIDYLVADNREGMMWFANMGCIEVHPFHSRADQLDLPDYAIFDFDPADGSTWDQLVAGVQLLKVALERLGLTGYPKLSGSKGLHVYVPLDPVHSYERVRRFVGEVGSYLSSANPDDLTMQWDKPKRKGKVYIDHNRNASGQTVAAAYSVRPRPGAPISVPLHWSEVSEVKNGDFTIVNIWDRIQRHGDLFAPVVQGGQTLEKAEEALGIES